MSGGKGYDLAIIATGTAAQVASSRGRVTVLPPRISSKRYSPTPTGATDIGYMLSL